MKDDFLELMDAIIKCKFKKIEIPYKDFVNITNHFKAEYERKIRAIEYIEHCHTFSNRKTYVNGDDLLEILKGE